jgi:hypothetical protein
MSIDNRLYSEQEYERLALIVSRYSGGSLIDPRFALEHIRQLIEGYSREQFWLDRKLELQHIRQSRVLFGISDESRSARAFAAETTDWPNGFIVLSFNMIIQIMTYFGMVMCHPQLLPEWGNTYGEEWPRIANAEEIGFAPRDNERVLICRLLQRMALRFIISHELSHIVHGHLRYEAIQASSYSLDEALSSLSQEEAINRQALELDADINAIPECLGDSLIFTDTFNDGVERDWLNNSSPLLTHERVMKLWFFAVYSIFRIMANNRSQPPLRFSSHPRPMFRVMNFYLQQDAMLQLAGSDEYREGLAKACGEAILSGKQAFNSLGINPVIPDSEDDISFGSLSGAYPSMINEAWDRVRPLLGAVKTTDTELPVKLIRVEHISIERLLHHSGIQLRH